MRLRNLMSGCAAIIMGLSMFGCMQQYKSGSFVVLERRVLDSIPSGSGILLRNGAACIVGDDATCLYQLSLENFQQQKIAIPGLDTGIYRETKAVKHDFESATSVTYRGVEYLLAFGSGSKARLRDSILIANAADRTDIRILSLENFYRQLRQKTRTDSLQWNIEGAATVLNELILLNRAGNLLIRMNAETFLDHVFDGASPFPQIKYSRITLPAIEKHEARFSGACRLDDSHILFSASVEDTPDWISDGPVLGSFIGVYDLANNQVTACHPFLDESGIPLKEKIESVDLAGRGPDGMLQIYVIGDNDDGRTNLFRLAYRP